MSRFPTKNRQQVSRIVADNILAGHERLNFRKHYEQAQSEYHQTEGYIKEQARRKLLQCLDKANKNATNEQKVVNTLQFFSDFITLLKSEFYGAAENHEITLLDLTDLIKYYAVHIKVIRTFDSVTELNPSIGYSEPLMLQLKNELMQLDSGFLNLVDLETSVMLSL